jgi:hypothetical protein
MVLPSRSPALGDYFYKYPLVSLTSNTSPLRRLLSYSLIPTCIFVHSRCTPRVPLCSGKVQGGEETIGCHVTISYMGVKRDYVVALIDVNRRT